MYPTLEKVKEIAASGEYRRIPVCKELYADRYTPVEVMRVLRKASKHCYLLESASQTEVWGRFSFLGYEPAMEITTKELYLTSYNSHYASDLSHLIRCFPPPPGFKKGQILNLLMAFGKTDSQESQSFQFHSYFPKIRQY